MHIQAILAKLYPLTLSQLYLLGLSENGEFSTKIATWRTHGLDMTNPPSWEYKLIWSVNIMPKIKLLLWQLCH